MTTRIATQRHVLRVAAKGDFSLPEAQRSFLKVLNAAVRHGLEKILYDGRALTGEPETIERFFYGKFAAEAVSSRIGRGFSRPPKFAYVLEEPVLDPLRFGETVAVNRGMNVKAFNNLEDALNWLTSETPGRSE